MCLVCLSSHEPGASSGGHLSRCVRVGDGGSQKRNQMSDWSSSVCVSQCVQ